MRFDSLCRIYLKPILIKTIKQMEDIIKALKKAVIRSVEEGDFEMAEYLAHRYFDFKELNKEQ